MQEKVNQMLNISLFPLKDLAFFHKDLICEAASNKSKDKDMVLNKICNSIINKHSIRNIDEINLVIKKYYPLISEYKDFEKYEIYKHYLEILENYARCFISHRDGEIVYKYWKNQNDDGFLGPYDELQKIQIFHSFSKIISMDLLYNVYLVMNNIEDISQINNFFDDINLADMQLDDVLIGGVAETHIHANASFNFNLSWECIVNEKVKWKKNSFLDFNEFVNSDFQKTPKAYIDLAIIYRILLSEYIKLQNANQNVTFSAWLYEIMKQNVFREFIEHINENKILSEYDENYFDDIKNEVKKYFYINNGDRKEDIIFSILSEYKDLKTYGENIFLFKSLLYLKNSIKNTNKESFTLFSEFFFQYIRIKNEVYKQIVQEENIKGLNFFQEYFKRATSIVKASFNNKEEYYVLMLRTLFQNEYLKKVELRFSLPKNIEALKSMVYNILHAYKIVLDKDYNISENADKDFPRIGVIYHLIKESEENQNEKCWYMYNGEIENTYKDISFKMVQEKYKNQIKILTELRNKIAYISHFILGIDAASLENNTPVQVFAPVFEMARDSKQDPLINIDKHGNTVKNKSLAFTFHAGEDFRHVISGLRRIDEVIEYCKFHSGDRIGHATALGIDIDYWANENPVIILPQGEYLDNLLWVWGVYTKTQKATTKVSIYLEQQIYNLAKKIFINVNGINTSMLYEAYVKRFNTFNLDHKFKVNQNECKSIKDEIFCINSPERYRIIWSSEKLVYAYHCKCYLKNLNEAVYVSVKDIDIEITKEIQKEILCKVAKKGIVVEVNPSSNAIIGEMDSIFDHHAFTINNTNNQNYSNVMISINSDDPIVFNTNVSNEFAYLYYGLLYRGVNKELALEWIEKIRKCGMETSFINNKISNAQYYEYLTKALDELGCGR